MSDIIIFDLDGTILNGKYKHYECYKRIVEKYGGVPIDIDDYWHMKRNKIKRTTLLEKSLFRGTYADYMDMWLNSIEDQELLLLDKVDSQNIDFLKRLFAAGKTLILVTMRQLPENLHWELNNLNIEQYFHKIIVGDRQRYKCKYDILSELNICGDIVVGDTEEDENLATSMHAIFVAVCSGLRDRKYLKADYYLDHLYEMEDLQLF